MKALIAFGVLLVTMGIMRANDSMAEIAVGGLVFTKTADVAMRSEELKISEKSVDVLYHFYNNSTNPITSLVAFPMPDIGPDLVVETAGVTVPTQDQENLFGFVTTVNGKKVQARIEQKAIARNVDQSDLLRGMHIPLAQHLQLTKDAIYKLTPEQIKILLTSGLLEDHGSDANHDYYPIWTLKSAYFWEQTFPPQSETVIHHHYKPAVGVSVQASPTIGDGSAGHDYDKYGIDSDFVKAFKKRKTSDPASTNGFSSPWSEYRIGYILKTGANWAKPIGTFRLVVDKGEAENLLSFKGENVKKISPVEFEMIKTNFTPTQDIDILILKPLK